MKRTLVIFIFLAVIIPGYLKAQEKDFGLGIVLGEPTGVSLKKWLGEKSAIDGALAWSFAKEGSFHLHADYLIHDFSLIQVKSGKLPVYYGIGGRFKADGENRIGVRIPLGISYLFEKAPIDIFFEFVPLLDLAPGTKFWLNSSIGFRYYF